MSAAPFAVCVYCGSRFGDDPAFREAAEALGAGLAARGMRQVLIDHARRGRARSGALGGDAAQRFLRTRQAVQQVDRGDHAPNP